MTPWRLVAITLGFALIAIYAAGANYWNRDYSWYQSLNKPSWQPPDFIFGIIWPYNFIVIGIALYAIFTKASPAMVFTILALFAVSIASALRWSYLFYSAHNLPSAAFALLITAFLTLPILATTFFYSWKVGIALLPYQLWIFTAAALSFSYAANN
jgi:tryptophan-rich sensory protein